MNGRIVLAALAVALGSAGARAEPAMPLAPHRAAYEVSLVDDYDAARSQSQAPVAASGIIAYEFSGSRCDGYASNFRQFTELQRSEGDPLSLDVHAVTFEGGDAKLMRFRIDSRTADGDAPAVVGSASRSDGGDTTVALTKQDPATIDIGKSVLFPTEHIERIIAQAKAGGGTMQARVYDGSDTGKKVFQTLTVIGKEETARTQEPVVAETLGKMRRWPVTVSYFDEQARDAPPDYTLSFDLYENGVQGMLKLDYGAYALSAKLARLELLPTPACHD